ncbi:MAG TPA: orotidine-5'-phosphate decarboxylase [Tepidisphaeraceae bacterium]|jgi:orotidine-5'-phosphate decarboxylase
MPAPFADRLHAAIAAKGAPICVGLDPILDSFPPELKPADPHDLGAAVGAVRTFCSGVLNAVRDVAPAVKPQIAYFERFGPQGVALYYDVVAEAKSLGLLVIGDVKRGDIGATSSAYAAAHLADSPYGFATPDAITVNPYLGLDTLEPFLSVCREQHKGLFVLVRTSNPGSADLQDLRTDLGDTFAETLATKLDALNDSDGDYGPIGAVVGATQPHTMASLRQRMPRSIFLLPGYGTQGATADMTRSAFDANGRGAIVSASRSVLYPQRAAGESWQDAVRRAALAMRDDLGGLVR